MSKCLMELNVQCVYTTASCTNVPRHRKNDWFQYVMYLNGWDGGFGLEGWRFWVGGMEVLGWRDGGFGLEGWRFWVGGWFWVGGMEVLGWRDGGFGLEGWLQFRVTVLHVSYSVPYFLVIFLTKHQKEIKTDFHTTLKFRRFAANIWLHSISKGYF